MKSKARWKKYLPLILVGGIIPVSIVLGRYFHFSQAVVVPFIVVVSLIFASMALWAYANRAADGSEWWQDDSASGWRGY